ncbi:MAG: OmpA family protein [Gammaproteobacteria bacterium]|nr:OmpA family protein [Gammaproteobacteria bacterium]
MICRLLSILICVLVSSLATASQRYQASLEQSQWQLKTSPVRCELVHPIPRYGQGLFVHSAGGELAFEIHVLQPSMRDSAASVLSVPPFWKPGNEVELGQLSIFKGDMPIYMSQDMALKMLYELDKGMMPTFQYKDWATQEDDVSVVLSSANFYDALPQFQQCISQLLPYNIDQASDAIIHFSKNKFRLNGRARQSLDEIAMFAINYPESRIKIEGHADSRGTRRYNRSLSLRRAQTMQQYLVNKGVKPHQISISGKGERYPVASNWTPDGRAKNRRVIVSISRH